MESTRASQSTPANQEEQAPQSQATPHVQAGQSALQRMLGADVSSAENAARQLIAHLTTAPSPGKDQTRIPISKELVQKALPVQVPFDNFMYKQARVTAPLYTKQDGDTNDISARDVMQGNLGDCYFMAAVAAVALSNPDAIRKLIKQVDAHTYEVTLNTKDGFFSDGKASWHTVRVDDQFPLQRPGVLLGAQSPGSMEDPGSVTELWVMLIEKAYAVLEGGWGNEGAGSGVEQGLKAFDPAAHKLNTKGMSPDDIAHQIDTRLKQHVPVVTGSLPASFDDFGIRHILDSWKMSHPNAPAWFEFKGHDLANKDGVEQFHEYAVTKVDFTARRIYIQNPWGIEDADLSFEDFATLFNGIAVG